ncbi:hypothetical protein [Porphyromonas sp. COT-290 OH860]|uniref:hypothetical protein n=1 Tax=Porphyromonas sp. COT-290 OH860 TaxID=1515615 RepID=UPI00052CF3FE|nr:hypothetical protein [Porphyromonas sp. COT-290 OH860]KGN86084.1 hypothetical protein HQ41_02000 [Porphyromonas sp. COT-290 OH860]
MKYLRILQTLSALCLALSVYACGKDIEPQIEQEGGGGKKGQKDAKIEISLSSELSGHELRSMGLISDEELRALTFDTSKGNKAPKIFLTGNNALDRKALATTIFLRMGDQLVGYANIEWDEITHGPDGRIKLSARNKTATLMPINNGGSVKEPALGETWYMAAVMGGGKREGAKVTFKPNGVQEVNKQAKELQVPFVSKWIKAGLDKNNSGVPTLSGAFTFSPMGVLIKVEISNKTDFDYRAYANTTQTKYIPHPLGRGALQNIGTYLSPERPRFNLRTSANKRMAPYYMSEDLSRGLRDLTLDFSSKNGESVTRTTPISDGLASLMPNPKQPVTIIGTGAGNQTSNRSRKHMLFDSTTGKDVAISEVYAKSVIYWVWGQNNLNGSPTTLGLLEWEFPDLLAKGPRFERVNSKGGSENMQEHLLNEKRAYSVHFTIKERPSMPTEWILDEDLKESGSLGNPTGDLFDYDGVVFDWSAEGLEHKKDPRIQPKVAYPDIDEATYNRSTDIMKYVFPPANNIFVPIGLTGADDIDVFSFKTRFAPRKRSIPINYSPFDQNHEVVEEIYIGNGDGKVYAIRFGSVNFYTQPSASNPRDNEVKITGDKRPLQGGQFYTTDKLPVYFDGDQCTAYLYEFVDDGSRQPKEADNKYGKVSGSGKHLRVTTKYVGNALDQAEILQRIQDTSFWEGTASHFEVKLFYPHSDTTRSRHKEMDPNTFGTYFGDIFSGLRSSSSPLSPSSSYTSIEQFAFSKTGMYGIHSKSYYSENNDPAKTRRDLSLSKKGSGFNLRSSVRLSKKTLETHQRDVVTWYQYYRTDDGVTDYPKH